MQDIYYINIPCHLYINFCRDLSQIPFERIFRLTDRLLLGEKLTERRLLGFIHRSGSGEAGTQQVIPVVGIPLNANRCNRWTGKTNDSSVDLHALQKLILAKE